MRPLNDLIVALADLVGCESPSSDPAATSACLDLAAELVGDWLATKPQTHESSGRRHDFYRFDDGTGPLRVLLLAHLDTVWPHGTLKDLPFSVTDGVIRGPGVFDMKAGFVQGLAALEHLPAEQRAGVGLLLNTDEEIGSPTSRDLIERTAAGTQAVFVLEPSSGGALKTERKGVSMYDIGFSGRAAHAGLEPEKGVNALLEMANLILELDGLARSELGTTVTPTVASAGTTRNSVPEAAALYVDVRASTVAEQERVHRELTARRSVIEGASVVVEGGPNRPPLERSAAADLFARARQIWESIGEGELAEVHVGGGSDGNFTAGMGICLLYTSPSPRDS